MSKCQQKSRRYMDNRQILMYNYPDDNALAKINKRDYSFKTIKVKVKVINMLILVDCGTTNMRLRLYPTPKDAREAVGLRPLDEIKYRIGARDGVRESSSEILSSSLGRGIREICGGAGIDTSVVDAVICSGTLSSHIGIHHIHHVITPASIADTAAASELVHMPKVADVPILFIPGTKGKGDIMRTEVMSGEECELYGIAALCAIEGAFTLLLPGSYNKIITVDGEGRIDGIYSSMCGELTAAVSENTLLRRVVPHPAIREIRPDMLKWGAEFAAKWGLSPALSKVWVMPRLSHDSDDAANFMMGAILEGDMRIVSALQGQAPFYVGGSSPLRELLLELFRIYGIPATEVEGDVARIAPNIGAMLVYLRHMTNK